MNSRVRKGNKNERQLSGNRGGYKGGRQGTSQGFNKPQSRDFGKVQETILPEFSNAYTADSVSRLVGCTVQVHTLDGHIYDGVLDAISPNFEVCLKSAHLAFNKKDTRQDYYHTPSKDELYDISFALRNVIRIKCKNVDLDYARKDTFQTDSMISGSNGPTITERELTRWQADDSHVLGGLEDMSDLSNGIDYNEMKRTNEEKFNFKSTFTENSLGKYMDEIETDDPAYETRARRAAQTAREMEISGDHKYHDQLDSGVSEEEQFSSVKRPSFNSNSQGSNAALGRNAGMSNRGRGRSRGSQNYRVPANEAMDSHNDDRFDRNGGINNRRPPEQDEPPGPKKLFSQLFTQGRQHDIPNQNPIQTTNQQPQQRYRPVTVYQVQPSQPIHQPDMPTPPSAQRLSNSRQMGSHHSQGVNNQQFDVPPRMQQQQQHQYMANHTPRFSASDKPSMPIQRNHPQQSVSPRPEQRSASSENDRDFRKNTELPIDVSVVASPEKPVPASPVEAKPSVADDQVKPTSDLQKHKQVWQEDIPPQKFGKILPASRPQEENSSPKIEDLKNFSENFKLSEKHNKRSKKTGETPLSQQKDSRDHEDETMVIQVSPDPPVKRENEKVDTTTENMPQMDKLSFSPEKTASEAVTTAVREEKEEQVLAVPVKTEPTTAVAATAEEKKPEPLETPTTVQPQNQTPTAKKGLNPDAKEFRFNPNVQEFVPRSGSSSSPAPPQNVPTPDVTQYPVVTASTPSVVASHFSNRIPTVQPRMRDRAYQQVPPVVENQHQALYTMPHQAMQQQQQQHQQPQPQPQQPALVYVQYQAQPPQMISAMPPQAHVAHHRPLVTAMYPEGQNLILLNPGPGQIMQQQQPQQQQQQVHQISFSHSSTPTPQPQVHHYMVQPGSQHYPQITSPLQSTPQGAMPHGMHRPLTPSQHAVLPAATPPLHHPGQQPSCYNPMTIANMQSQLAFVAPAQRGQGHMSTFQ